MALSFTLHIKHLKKFLNVLGGHLTIVNKLSKEMEGSYAYSLRVEGMFHLLIGKISLLAYSLELLAPRESFGIKHANKFFYYLFSWVLVMLSIT
jgi:hypothetical protein